MVGCLDFQKYQSLACYLSRELSKFNWILDEPQNGVETNLQLLFESVLLAIFVTNSVNVIGGTICPTPPPPAPPCLGLSQKWMLYVSTGSLTVSQNEIWFSVCFLQGVSQVDKFAVFQLHSPIAVPETPLE
jgi:hypothetical protein